MKDEFVRSYMQFINSALADKYIDADIGIEGFKKKIFESAESMYNFLNENYPFIHLNDVKPSSSLPEFLSTYFGNMDNLIEYLLTNQEGYAVSTIEAWDILPEIFGLNLALETGYRHAYITILSPPIHHKNMIIEWTGETTDEKLQKRVNAKFQTSTPGVVILGLIAADNQLKATGNYSFSKYIPWKNDCHTFALHVQQKMNEILPVEFRQRIITLPTHVAPNAPLEECATTKKKSIENYSKKMRSDRDINTPAETQLSHINRHFKALIIKEKDEIEEASSTLNKPLI